MEIRVLHSIPSIDPSYGGPVSVLKGLVSSLKSFDVTPSILTCSTGDPGLDETNTQSFPDTDIIWVNPLIHRFYWTPFLSLRKGRRLYPYDLFHVHGLFNGLSSAACRIARSLDVPYILEPFGTLSPYCLSKNALMKTISMTLTERRNIECAAAIKFSSEGERQRFNLNFRSRCTFVAGNGLDWKEFSQLPAPGMFRNRHGIKPLDTVFLFLGRLQLIKGLEIFFQGFSRWKQQNNKGTSAKLVMVGPDEAGYQRKLERLASELHIDDATLFAGPLYGSGRLEALVDSDVVVLPSYHENFGITAVEGMACRKPVLISEQVDIWPEVKEHDLGEIAATTSEGMMDALNRIVSRKHEWSAIGDRGRVWAQEYCNWDKIAEMISMEYQRIMKINIKQLFHGD